MLRVEPRCPECGVKDRLREIWQPGGPGLPERSSVRAVSPGTVKTGGLKTACRAPGPNVESGAALTGVQGERSVPEGLASGRTWVAGTEFCSGRLSGKGENHRFQEIRLPDVLWTAGTGLAQMFLHHVRHIVRGVAVWKDEFLFQPARAQNSEIHAARSSAGHRITSGHRRASRRATSWPS